MEGFLQILIIIIGFVVLYLLLKKELEKKFFEKDVKEREDGLNIFQVLNNLKEEIAQKLESSLTSTAKTEEILRVFENYANELMGLKQILAGPKSRGILGEKSLEEILKELPNKVYEIQYRIGLNVVDAVLRLNDTIIPIDSKFPYNNFIKFLNEDKEDEKERLRRELIKNIKNHIEVISKKYIEPLRGTVEYAIMYIPAEGLYYEILDKEYSEIWDFAREKSVFLASPKTFEILSANLGLALKKQEFAKNIKEILSHISQLEKDIFEIGKNLEKAKTQLSNSYNNLEEVFRAFNRFYFNFKELIKKESDFIEEEKKIKERSLI
ncbi:MAG: DNA recombination protein RmuC [Minisyncoccia bacterium]